MVMRALRESGSGKLREVARGRLADARQDAAVDRDADERRDDALRNGLDVGDAGWPGSFRVVSNTSVPCRLTSRLWSRGNRAAAARTGSTANGVPRCVATGIAQIRRSPRQKTRRGVTMGADAVLLRRQRERHDAVVGQRRVEEPAAGRRDHDVLLAVLPVIGHRRGVRGAAELDRPQLLARSSRRTRGSARRRSRRRTRARRRSRSCRRCRAGRCSACRAAGCR